MDIRLIVTVPVAAYFVVLGVFGLSLATVDVAFTEGQPIVVAVLGAVGPLIAFGLVWLGHYVYGAALFVATLLPNAWFVSYLFLVHDNPANALVVTGDGAIGYLMAVIGLVACSVILAGVAGWLWYRESPRFRARLRGFARLPPAEK